RPISGPSHGHRARGNGPASGVPSGARSSGTGTSREVGSREEIRPLVQTTAANGAERRRHTLLVVDDEVDVLDSVRHQSHRTYHARSPPSGSRGRELLGTPEVEGPLPDQRMPGMSGDVLLRHARQLKPDTIRMLFTGYADIQAVINAVNEGHIFRYILKPWDSIELEGIIRQGIEQYELLAERRRLIAELQAANARLGDANAELRRAR